HGATLKTLFHYLKGTELDELKEEKVPRNTSYTIVKYENKKFEIIDFSNISHLENI
ncbi:MAG: histidine phosphatase family protein, partial [Fusobacterium gastrosuis]|nr:histidine phosphatase family protein [Fusobacterium gastrosuis]